jgi:hypothetical protein
MSTRFDLSSVQEKSANPPQSVIHPRNNVWKPDDGRSSCLCTDCIHNTRKRPDLHWILGTLCE